MLRDGYVACVSALPPVRQVAAQILLCSPDSIAASLQVCKMAARNAEGEWTSEAKAQVQLQ